MGGLIRAEWLRLRKRRSLLAIALAVPLLVAFFLLAGYFSIPQAEPFDAAAARQQLIDDGIGIGMTPEEAEQLIADLVESQRQNHEQELQRVAFMRERFAFPQSVVTALGTGTFLMFALILLTATTLGDEFGWGTVRTALLANSQRRRFLAVRLGFLVATGAAVIVATGLLGVIAPLVLSLTGADLPVKTPVDWTAIGVLALGETIVCAAVIGFSALVTVVARSGSLALVGALLYLVVEGAILALLSRFEPFQQNGDLVWSLDLLPLHGLTTFINTASAAASGLGNVPGEVLDRALDRAAVPLVALLAWAALFWALAFRRFSRMDIVE